jgi:hypothetical protein
MARPDVIHYIRLKYSEFLQYEPTYNALIYEHDICPNPTVTPLLKEFLASRAIWRIPLPPMLIVPYV